MICSVRYLVQNGGSGLKAQEMSLAEWIQHSNLKSGSDMPPWEVGRITVWKAGCILEPFHRKLLRICCMDLM